MLEHGWQELGAAAILPTQHPDFVRAAAGAYLAAQPQLALQAIGAGGIEGLAPLVRDRGIAARWRMIGAEEVHEPVAPLFADAAAAERLAERLCALGRAVEFSRIPAHSPMVEALERAAARGGLLLKRRAQPSPWLALDGSWREAETHFSARRRSDFRRARRRAEAFGTVSFAMHRPCADGFEALFEQAIAVEAKSWKRAAGTAILCDPAKRAFFHDYLGAAAARGEARIAAMRIDGAMVAMQLAVVWRSRYWLYKIGFDETHGACSPGTLLMLHALGECAREGLAGFEMMGEADPWISDLWTRQAHRCLRLRFYPPTVPGLLALGKDGLAWMRRRARIPARFGRRAGSAG